MNMKQDRFLVGILLGIGILVALALGVFFTRRANIAYVDDSTPQGVTKNYLIALYQEDYQKAYSYLAEKPYKPSLQEFMKPFLNGYTGSFENSMVELGETRQTGEIATVQVLQNYGDSAPFDSGYRGLSDTHALLILQEGQWKIEQMPYEFWYYEWYQKTE